MTDRDSTMFALYLVIIALGSWMMSFGELALGFIQLCVGALFFGLRLNRIFNNPKS